MISLCEVRVLQTLGFYEVDEFLNHPRECWLLHGDTLFVSCHESLGPRSCVLLPVCVCGRPPPLLILIKLLNHLAYIHTIGTENISLKTT